MKNKILIIILVVAVIVLAALIGVKFALQSKIDDLGEINNDNSQAQETRPQAQGVKIWSGNSRSVAIVVDNVGEARPQAGLNDAAIVYEVTVEGGLTRLLAIYKDVDKEKTLGPVRSARPVFLDYTLENDSIFVHFGYSIKARQEIDQLKIQNVNGLVAEGETFWRTSEKPRPHNALTNMNKILAYSDKNGYRTTSTQKSVLNYVPNEVELENGQAANNVNIPYTSSYKVTFKYNAETKLYERYVNGAIQKDWLTDAKRTTKNIIITYANNHDTNEEEGYDRQEIENIGTLNGYYITNGQAIKITCSKASREAQTVYRDENGKEIEVNDGNTYIQIVPLKTNVTLE